MPEKVIVIHPVLMGQTQDHVAHTRDPDAALSEAVGLVAAIDLSVVDQKLVRLNKITPSTFIGSGTVADIKALAQETDTQLIFVNHTLTPGQQRNLEQKLDCKVIDRTGMILEIFGARARTKEGRLQVELAALSYQRSRLVRAWTHLERQRGGAGFMGGPGERQIELDRRMLDEKIKRLKKDLESVKQNRRLQRQSRKKEPYPIIALVGYTNAGKSTLFNYLTGAGVFAKDLLFATLDTTMRAIELPSGMKVIVSDTVGFISDLPTHLVAAFRATLEEVQEASLILHVRDVAQDETGVEKQDVEGVLRDLGIDTNTDPRMIEVWNKIDLLPKNKKPALINRSKRQKNVIAISAQTGEGVEDLCALIYKRLAENHKTVYIDIDLKDGAALAWLYRRGHIIEREDMDAATRLKLRLSPEDCERFAQAYPYKLKQRKPRKVS